MMTLMKPNRTNSMMVQSITGRLGTVYRTVLYAHEIIDESQLNKDDKEKEKAKLFEARKTAFGNLF